METRTFSLPLHGGGGYPAAVEGRAAIEMRVDYGLRTWNLCMSGAASVCI